MKKVFNKILLIVIGAMMTSMLHAAEFGTNSTNMSNTYLGGEIGTAVILAGYGTRTGQLEYTHILGTEVVDGVKCVRVNSIRTEASEYTLIWIAADNNGDIYALKLCDPNNQPTCSEVGKDNAVLIMPKNPKVGDMIMGGSEEVVEVGVIVPQLSTGLGPFSGCIKTIEDDGDIEYSAPGFGIVKKEYSGEVGGWELSEILKTKTRVAVIPLFD